ncbi:MAG: hypothetical protein AAFY76_05570, partial [Cyanobacteria bacterium J06649_11]
FAPIVKQIYLSSFGDYMRFKPFLCQKIKPYLDQSKRNARVFKCDLKELFAAMASIYFNLTPASL